jgi:hypothetical protein
MQQEKASREPERAEGREKGEMEGRKTRLTSTVLI